MRKAAAAVVVGLAWIYTAAHFAMTGVRQPLGNFTGDFLASFPSWRVSVLTGRMDMFHGSLAGWWAMKFSNYRPLWHYGPVEHLVTLPLFAFRDLRTAYMAWLIANYVFLAGILILAWYVFRSDRARWFWRSVVIIAVLNYGPLFEALTQRTIEIFELLLILGAFALLQRRHPTASGTVIGFAAMTKFLPLIFLPYFFVKRSWRLLASSLAVVIAIGFVTEFVFQWRYSGIVLQLRAGDISISELDQSLAGFILRLLGWTRSSLSPFIMTRAAILIALIGLSFLFLRIRNCAAAEDLEWSTLIVAMVLLPPHNEQYYFVLLLFPYLALLARELRPGAPARLARRSWLAISFLLTGAPVPLSVLNRLTGLKVFSIYLSLAIPFIGAAILAAICVRAVVDECASPQVVSELRPV